MKFENFEIGLLKSDEGALFFDLIDRNRPRLEDFFAGTLSKTQTLEDTIVYCKENMERINNKDYFPFLIKDLNTNRIVGLVDVKNIDWKIPKAELGSFIDKDYEGQGVTTKAAKLVVNHIVKKHKFIKLLCRANTRNKGSIAVILKSGFEFEGTIRRDYRTSKGEIVDLNYYGRVFNFD